MRGSIRFYNEKQAYGFIERESPGRDVFVHFRDIDADSSVVEVGLSVTFDVVTSERGPRAVDVRIA